MDERDVAEPLTGFARQGSQSMALQEPLTLGALNTGPWDELRR
jgi:hypothetical protein